jgi:Spy/CpxP family protein refolding chaperone
MQGLDLTPDQQARIDAVQSTADTKRRNLLDSLGAENEKLNTLLSGESRDTDALTQQYARCAQLRRQIFELGLDERQKIDAVLTDDQRKQWRQWLHAYTSQ